MTRNVNLLCIITIFSRKFTFVLSSPLLSPPHPHHRHPIAHYTKYSNIFYLSFSTYIVSTSPLPFNHSVSYQRTISIQDFVNSLSDRLFGLPNLDTFLSTSTYKVFALLEPNF